jgi:lipoprotein-anchoring transpeptidase ErfK/SrfK
MLKRPLSALACAALLFGILGATNACAAVAIRIALAQQTMTVEVDGAYFATWAVSTARRGYRTPQGTFRPYALEVMHYSTVYDYTPMPYSIFFFGGFAIHGTSENRNLGRPVSHGCVRLSRENARALFDLVRGHGKEATTITIAE